jgi:hypothetical protein
MGESVSCNECFLHERFLGKEFREKKGNSCKFWLKFYDLCYLEAVLIQKRSYNSPHSHVPSPARFSVRHCSVLVRGRTCTKGIPPVFWGESTSSAYKMRRRMQIFGELIQRVKSSLAGQNCGTCLEIIIRRTALISLCWKANYDYAKLQRFDF